MSFLSWTKTLLRTFATPLFRAAGLDPNLVRCIVIRDDAINSFASTGNRPFVARTAAWCAMERRPAQEN
jgi:predicted Zn-dependent protease